MKSRLHFFASMGLTLLTLHATAAVLYVDLNSASPAPPYADWSTAATNIQDAVDASSDGDLVLVTNGLYQAGSRSLDGFTTNRVAVSGSLTLRSVNGPSQTIIDGGGAVRCVFLADGATLDGFTLQNGVVAANGGGVAGESTNAFVINCIITQNNGQYGGGVFQCTASRCIISTNSAYYNGYYGWGGGANGCVLNNCLINGNFGYEYGGAAVNSTMNNCTVTGNHSRIYPNTFDNCIANNCIVYFNYGVFYFYNGQPYYFTYNGGSGTLNHCCITPDPGGTGNITSDPFVVDAANGDFHLQSGSPCINAGDNSCALAETDLDGSLRIQDGTVDIGAYEFPGYIIPIMNFAADRTNVAAGYPIQFSWRLFFTNAPLVLLDFGDGTIVTNADSGAIHRWSAPGDYTVQLLAFSSDYPSGTNASIAIHIADATNYVSSDSTNPVPPYNSWATAATNIQDGVDAAVLGATVLVGNGVYDAGGRALTSLTNRVAVILPIVVKSVNGPAATSIVGYQVPGTINDFGAVRCVYLGEGAMLSGFTITNGATEPDDDQIYEDYGGGVACGDPDSIITNCVIVNNSSSVYGGGVYGGIVLNCALIRNQSGYGGGAVFGVVKNSMLTGNGFGYAGGGAGSCELDNCTVTGNSSSGSGGGVESCRANNCIIYYNLAPSQPDHSSGLYSDTVLNFCCTPPFPGAGTNNFAAEPQLTDDAHLAATSPCIGAGSPGFSSGTDIDGEPWLNPPSVGCDEFYAGPVSGTLSVAVQASYTNVATGFRVNLSGSVIGHASYFVWDFGDGTFATNQLALSHAWTFGGNIPVTLTAFNDDNPAGISATVFVRVWDNPVHYVSPDSANPLAPYLTWDTAATNIQDAVDAAVIGGTVLVTNGIYQTGGRPVHSLALTNRVAVTKIVTVQSVNGPDVTFIEGYHEPGTVLDFNGARCVYLTNGATLTGFTLTNGATQPGNDQDGRETIGGGVWCESSAATVSNCVIAGCAAVAGGGAENGTLNHCTISGNTAGFAGGADNAVVNDCALTGNSAFYSGYGAGGGAGHSTLNNCVLADNSADYGGGAGYCTLNNCALYGNSSGGSGGGAGGSTLNNCTLTGNSAPNTGGGADSSTLNNCIAYYNLAVSETNCSSSTLNFSCTTPLPDNNVNTDTGTNNIIDPPQLADNFHLNAASPCIGAGNADYSSGVDIDGQPWLNPPSIGCDEFYPGATGDLMVAISADYTEAPPGYALTFTAQLVGRASANVWDFGDGSTTSNQVFFARHSWASPGDYPVVFTAFNDDHPGGISATTTVHVAAQLIYHVDAGGTNPVAPYLSWDTAATNIQDAIDVALPVADSLVLVTNGTYAAGAQVTPDSATNRVVVTKPVVVQSVNGPAVTVIDGLAVERCVYLTTGAMLAGFTVTNGLSPGDGGGIFCQDATAIVTNCLLTGNFASGNGGGISGGTMVNCTLIGNQSEGGGGGADSSMLNNCIVADNSAGYGGGVENCTLNNCTVAGNSGSGGINIGGAQDSTLNNSIVYYNTNGGDYGSSTLNYCCTASDPGGVGNITNEPVFVNSAGGDYHLTTNSPCINSGNNAYVSVTNDLDGLSRIVGGTVDIGAYEYQTPSSILSYAWAQRFGLATDGSADNADADGDGMNNWQEWKAGTNPTNALSLLKMVPGSQTNNSGGITVTWQSVEGVNYFIQSSGDLSAQPPFTTIQSNIVGQAGTTSFTDTTATNGGPYFYRVGVQ